MRRPLDDKVRDCNGECEYGKYFEDIRHRWMRIFYGTKNQIEQMKNNDENQDRCFDALCKCDVGKERSAVRADQQKIKDRQKDFQNFNRDCHASKK